MRQIGSKGSQSRSLHTLMRGSRQGRTMVADVYREGGQDHSLHERARQRYHGPSFNAAELSAGEIADLVSELEVHQIELEIQNEELERTKRELDRAQEKYLDLYDFAPVGYLMVGVEGLITEVNLTFCSMTGQTRGNVIGRPLSRLIVPDDRAAYYRVMSEMKANARESRLELRIMRSDGRVFWCCLRFAPMPDETHRVVHLRAAVSDISEQKAVEFKLRDSEHRFRSLFEAVADFVHLLDAEGVVLETNEHALVRLGYHHEEFVGHRLDEFFTESSRRRFRESFPHLLEGGCYREEVEIVSSDGKTLPVDCQGTAVRGQNGQVAFYVFWERDITAKKEAQRKHASLLEELRRKNEDLQHFTSMIRNDLGNPILAFQGFSRELGVSCRQVEQLLDDQPVDTQVRGRLRRILREDIGRSLEFIESSAAEMQGLLEGLRQLATVGTVTLRIEPVDMNALMNQIVGSMTFQIEACAAEVTVEALPGCRGDCAQIQQVFSNLVSNALKYLDDDRPGRIRIGGEVQDGRSVYCVEDNGIGMAPEQKDRVFDIFYRAEIKSEAAGEGLGLSIAERILSRLNGSIRVESEAGQGSRFFVSLPRA